MTRISALVCVLSVIVLANAQGQDRLFRTIPNHASGGLISLCQDPNCPGCRAFLAGYGSGPSCSCERGPTGMGPMAEGAPSAEAEMALGEQLYADTGGAGYGYESAAPFMIGDFFGGGYTFGTFAPGRGTGIPIAAGDRRFKTSDNLSPIPRDRVYFTYNQFTNAVNTIEGEELDVRRGTVGVEKTFWDGMGSFEFRMPFAAGLAADQTTDGNTANDSDTEFGNLTIAPKITLASSDLYLLATGVGINLPTAQNGSIDGTIIENEAVHFNPFLGLLLTPTDRLYVMTYAQADFDASGYSIVQNGVEVGQLQEQTLVHLDLAVGRWFYRNEGARLSGIAPQIELHYSTTVQDPDSVAGITNPSFRTDTLALTGGVNFQFFNTSMLTISACAPLRGNRDPFERQYDGELQIYFNRFFY
jgi:hypothetical protein